MSHLIPDFVLNPVLRQARRFSRANPTEDPDQQTEHQAGLNSSDETDVAGVNEPDGAAEGTEVKTGDVLPSGSRAASPSFPEERCISGGVEEAEQNTPSPPRAISERPDMALQQLSSDSERIEAEASVDPSHSSGDVSGEIGIMDSPSRPPTQDSSQSGPTCEDQKHALPADDGMGSLREKILQLQSMPVSTEEKAKSMHMLLAGGYYRSQEASSSKEQQRPISPESIISQERPSSPPTLSSILWHMNGVVDDTPPEEQYTFHLTPDDIKPTYAPRQLTESDGENSVPSNGEGGEDAEEDIEEDTQNGTRILGCQHYQRNVKLQCSTCDRWYTCRLCHDEVEDHVLIRHATKNMLCMVCGSAQRAGEFCVKCGERAAWYYCDVCKLWDNDTRKSIYHCNDCGICRKGRGLGKDFFHCKTCGVCMTMAVENDHKCIERASDCNCPICGDYMFNSPRSVVFMLCGHGIHHTCYYEHQKTSYKCPICNKSTINMEAQFLNLDRAIQSQPMPPEFRDTQAMISCNDCYAKSLVKYHWLGLKCAICDSYNTTQLSILSDPKAEAPPDEGGEAESRDVPDQNAGDHSSSTLLVPGSTRHRRHSSYMYPAEESSEADGIAQYSAPQRVARSVSPMNRRGFLDSFAALFSGDTDDSDYDEDVLDFWGREGPRSTTTVENIEDDMDDDMEESDSDDEGDDCDGDDDEDEFELLGHR